MQNGSNFGAVNIDTDVGSLIFTCDFNSDLACRLRDIVDSAKTAEATAPLPTGLPLIAAALGTLGLLRRRSLG